ncbi:MAG: hypothetical protein HKN76_11780 [Saprospiraceae bacterium]|nr:hypothetical protein [Saprospiraceae bacterium]
MLKLKPLSKDSIGHALERAKHYRLLNQPWQAESICRDILNVEPSHQEALVTIILCITDQFAGGNRHDSEAREICANLTDKYQQKYYRGIIAERSGKAALKRKTPRAKYIAYEFYRQALNFFEEAEKLQPEGDQDTVLRWNSCVRAIEQFKLEASPDEDYVVTLLDV